MKLNKALKVKNRLAGEVARLQQILSRENARRSDSVSKVARDVISKELDDTREQLIKVKTAISRANINIYEKIQRLAEYKGFIVFIQSLPVRDGEEVSFIGHDREKLVYTWDSYIKREDVDKLVKEYQIKIETLQDEVDAFNSITEANF